MNILNFNTLNEEQSILFNSVSIEIREKFNFLISLLSVQHSKSLEWHLSSIVSRNTYQSSLFIWCCQLALVEKLFEENKNPEIIYTDSPGMKRVLMNFYRDKNSNVKIIYLLGIADRFTKMVKPVLRIGNNMLSMSKSYFYSRLSKKKNITTYSVPITLLDSFVLQSSFKENSNHYIDRYYTGILDYLTDVRSKFIFYVPTLEGVKNYRKTFRKLRCEENNFLLKEDYLRFSDYCFSFTSMFITLRLAFLIREEPSQFLSFNILPLIHEEIKSTWTNNSTTQAILNYLFVKRLSEKNVPLRLVIDWNENQVIDRGLIKGMHDFYPQTPTIGYQGYVVSSQFNIYIHPTSYENSYGVVPNELAVMGHGLIDVTKEFCPDLNVITAPAARFQKIWNDGPIRTEETKKTILIPLPITLVDCKNILESVAIALLEINSFEIEVLIKQHPSLDQNTIRKLFKGKWPDCFKFIEDDFHNILRRSNLVISSTSSACVESIAKGVPVIIIGNKTGITQNPIPIEIKDDIWNLCSGTTGLVDSIAFFLSRTKEKILEHIEVGKKIRSEYFEPMTKEAVLKFLKYPISE